MTESLTASSAFARDGRLRELVDVSGEKHSLASIFGFLKFFFFFHARQGTQFNLVIATLVTGNLNPHSGLGPALST